LIHAELTLEVKPPFREGIAALFIFAESAPARNRRRNEATHAVGTLTVADYSPSALSALNAGIVQRKTTG
jgi:hypothetical protein